MRWTKVSNAYQGAYKAWADVFLQDSFARFSLFRIDTSSIDWSTFRPQDSRKPAQDDKLALAFYQFLVVSFGKLRDTKRWWVYPDRGFFSQDSVVERVEFLFNRTYKKAFGPKTSRIIRMMRPLDSRKSDLIQLTDILLGLSSYYITGDKPQSVARGKLLDHYAAGIQMMPMTKTSFQKVIVKNWAPPNQFRYP